jgi:hypothetical protein
MRFSQRGNRLDLHGAQEAVEADLRRPTAFRPSPAEIRFIKAMTKMRVPEAERKSTTRSPQSEPLC